MSILFITSTHIGDAILSSGLLARVMEDYPDEPVTIACGPPAAKVFEAVPRLEHLHVIRKRRRSRHWFELWSQMRGRQWNVLVDLRRSLLPYVLRAQHKYVLPKSREPIHRVAAISTTIAASPLDPRIWIADKHAERARQLVGDGNDLLVLAPGATWAGKIWPIDHFVELAHRLCNAGGVFDGSTLLVVGAADERAGAQPLFDAFPHARVIDAMGVDILSTYAAMQNCRMFVGNDSAMMHLAAATGRPTVGMFGPTRDVHYAPWGDNGLVVRTPESVEELTEHAGYDTRTTGTLMKGLTPTMVEQAIFERWGNEFRNSATLI